MVTQVVLSGRPISPVVTAIPLPQSSVAEQTVAQRFKTRLCNNFTESGRCPYGNSCMFAHGDHDLRSEEINVRDGLTTEASVRQFQRVAAHYKGRPLVVGATNNSTTTNNTRRANTNNNGALSTVEAADQHASPEARSALTFKTTTCKSFMLHGTCRYGDLCLYAHGYHDVRSVAMNLKDGLTSTSAIRKFQHVARRAAAKAPPAQPAVVELTPEALAIAKRFKARLCKNYSNSGACPYGDRCLFAHGKHELRTEAMNIHEGLTNDAAIRAFQLDVRDCVRDGFSSDSADTTSLGESVSEYSNAEEHSSGSSTPSQSAYRPNADGRGYTNDPYVSVLAIPVYN